MAVRRMHLAREVAEWLIIYGRNRSVEVLARKGLRGWLCGTYAGHLCSILENKVMRRFSEEELEFILSHLPETKMEAAGFHFILTDSGKQEKCDELSRRLNEMIPKVRLNSCLV